LNSVIRCVSSIEMIASSAMARISANRASLAAVAARACA